METEKTVYHCALDWGCETEKVAPMLYRAVSDCVGSFELPFGYVVKRVVVRCVNSEKELYLFDIEHKTENNIVHFKIPENTVFVNTFDMPVDIILYQTNPKP